MVESDRNREIRKFVENMAEVDLLPFYNEIGHRLDLIRKAKDLYALKEFHVLDRVFFHHGSEHIEGTISRINTRTVSIVTADQRRWTVSPQNLKKINIEQEQTQDVDMESLSERFIELISKYPPQQNLYKKSKKRKKAKKRR